jgi:hypothetical protein
MNVLGWIPSFGWRLRRAVSRRARHGGLRRIRPRLEHLEPMTLLSVTSSVISGYVFLDCNSINPALTNNGLFDVGEVGIPNSLIELENANHQVIGVTTTDQNGYYQFTTSNVSITQTVTQSLSYSNYTNFSDQALLPPLNLFDPSLGQLVAVTITSTGTLSSTIKVTNNSPTTSTYVATLNGTESLSGLPTSANLINSFSDVSTPVTLASGQSTTFAPPGQPSLMPTSTQSITLTSPSDLAFFIASPGRTTISPTVSAVATANVTSIPNGATFPTVTTTANASVTITYTYTSSTITPGQYYIVQPQVPAGYIEGKASSNGVVIPNPGVPATIPLTVTAGNYPNNDFGELLPPANLTMVKFYGVHHQQTQIVLTFDRALNPTQANNVANYTLQGPLPIGRARPRQPLPTIPLLSAVYNPANFTVTLTPAHHLNVHYHYRLTTNLPHLTPCCNGSTVVTDFGGRQDLGDIVTHRGEVFVFTPSGHLVPVGYTTPPSTTTSPAPTVTIEHNERATVRATAHVSSRRDRLAPSAVDHVLNHRDLVAGRRTSRVALISRRHRG